MIGKYSMYIIDPIYNTNNLAKSVNAHNYSRIKELFSYMNIKCGEILKSRINNSYTPSEYFNTLLKLYSNVVIANNPDLFHLSLPEPKIIILPSKTGGNNGNENGTKDEDDLISNFNKTFSLEDNSSSSSGEKKTVNNQNRGMNAINKVNGLLWPSNVEIQEEQTLIDYANCNINNINHFMQENNNGKEIYRGIQRYKVGDPILFNDAADSFFSSDEDEVPIIHNNMKAKIVDFAVLNEGQANESIQFDVELDKPLIALNMDNRNFNIIGTNQEGNSIIRFEVFKNKSTDEDDDETSRATVPFQIAYAVSIHKAQGLEYDSVKIVITDEIDELITHSIFYTAITRAKKRLKIYWSKSVEQKILERIKPIDNRQDIALLKSEIV